MHTLIHRMQTAARNAKTGPEKVKFQRWAKALLTAYRMRKRREIEPKEPAALKEETAQ